MDPVLLSYHDATLRQSDIDTLCEGEWINDAVIAFMYEIFARECPHIGFWPPSIVELLCSLSASDDIHSLIPPEKAVTFLPGMICS